MQREIEMRADEFDSMVNTIYFGGGTPSLLRSSEISEIINKLSVHFTIAKNAEVSLEANPDDLNREKLQELYNAGINRLSIGIQSLNDRSLKWMNRAHNCAEARSCIADAIELGFDNISIDLIYGLPNLTLKEWEDEINEILSFNIQHISAYCLTVEPETALGHRVKKGKEKPVDEESANEQFQILVELLEQNGMEQYEVSNFGKPGFYSRHNTSYWKGVPYLGLGPSAHSYSSGKRSWNIANNARYIKSINEDKLPISTENLSDKDQINEYIMTGLRTIWGIDLDVLKNEFGYDLKAEYSELLEELIEKSLVKLEGAKLTLTKAGLFLADGIASDFFILEHDY